MNEWDREFEVDAEALRRVAAPARGWRLLSSGWDCDAWLADEAVVWRVPRRKVGIAAIEREALIMPRLAPRLPARVPVPVLVHAKGLPPLARHELVPGRELAVAMEAGAEPGAVLGAGLGAGLGAALGGFMRALHLPDHAREMGHLLPTDPMGRSDPARRIPLTHARLDAIAHVEDVGPLRAIVDAAAGPAHAASVVCHGDLHIRHVVVDDAAGLGGVIDWGDCCVGAVAMDLAVVTALDPAGSDAFFGAYGAVDAAAWRHARMLGVMFGAILLAADPEGPCGRGARRWLRRLRDGVAAA